MLRIGNINTPRTATADSASSPLAGTIFRWTRRSNRPRSQRARSARRRPSPAVSSSRPRKRPPRGLTPPNRPASAPFPVSFGERPVDEQPDSRSTPQPPRGPGALGLRRRRRGEPRRAQRAARPLGSPSSPQRSPRLPRTPTHRPRAGLFRPLLGARSRRSRGPRNQGRHPRGPRSVRRADHRGDRRSHAFARARPRESRAKSNAVTAGRA